MLQPRHAVLLQRLVDAHHGGLGVDVMRGHEVKSALLRWNRHGGEVVLLESIALVGKAV